MSKLKRIYCPFHGAGAEENAQILQPGIKNSKLCELVELPSKVRTLHDPKGPYIDACPQTSGRPEDVDLMILHGSMTPEQAIVWREQYPDIPAVMLDYKDELRLFHPDVRVLCHFKRNMAIRQHGKPLGVGTYGDKVVHFSPYCVREDVYQEMQQYRDHEREMDVCCFFEPNQAKWEEHMPREFHRGIPTRQAIEKAIGFCGTRRLIASMLAASQRWYGCNFNMHIGKTGGGQTDGRRSPQSEYCHLMATTKIIVTATPDGWEGDYRLMEAMSSGALVLHNRMMLPPHGLVDGKHWVVYDNHTDMLEKMYYYMHEQQEASNIGQAGREFVLNNHRPHHRVESWLRAVNCL